MFVFLKKETGLLIDKNKNQSTKGLYRERKQKETKKSAGTPKRFNQVEAPSSYPKKSYSPRCIIKSYKNTTSRDCKATKIRNKKTAQIRHEWPEEVRTKSFQ